MIAAASSVAAGASAAIVVDGNLDAAYGAAKSVVGYDPNAPEGNFGSPTAFSNAIGFSIYLASDSNYVYGFFNSGGPGTAAGTFANVYWDLDPQNNNGSDLGFELSPGHADASIPGVSGSVNRNDVLTATNGSGSFEFAIPVADFTSAIAGLTYAPGQVFPGAGDNITLRLSQSFGYSVAGGPSYGPDRLGTVAAGVPEPGTWALMLIGFGALGLALRANIVATRRLGELSTSA